MKNLAGDFKESPKELSLNFLYQNKASLLKEALFHFASTTSLIPKIGLELEFYLMNKDGSRLENHSIVDDFILNLSELTKNQTLIYKIEKEQGVGQIEVKTSYHSDLLKVCEEIEEVKIISQKLAFEKKLIASFAAQPFLDDCGSALQFNISLHDKDDKNLFIKKDQVFLNTIAALLNFTDAILILLAPNSEDYLRFDEEVNRRLYKKGKYTAPVNLSYGANNRTCAIRVPVEKTSRQTHCIDYEKRVEYRVAAANSDSYVAIFAILKVILSGIEKNLIPTELGFDQIHGNAFDQQYNLKSFAKTYEKALENFLEEKILTYEIF